MMYVTAVSVAFLFLSCCFHCRDIVLVSSKTAINQSNYITKQKHRNVISIKDSFRLFDMSSAF